MTARSKHSLMSFVTGKDTAEKYNSRDPTLPVHEPSSAPPSEAAPKSPTTVRKEIAAFLGELIGTFMFLFLAFTGTQIALNAAGTQQLTSSDNPAPDVSKLIYISFSFGVSLAINVAIFADISGGKFNPAVSLAKHFALPQPHSMTLLPQPSITSIVAQCTTEADLSLGNNSTFPHWQNHLASRYPNDHFPDDRGYSCCWFCKRSAAGAANHCYGA